MERLGFSLVEGYSKYKEFVVANVAKIASLESSLRSFSYFLPGRFKDAEYASELLFTGVNLFTFVNDIVLAGELTGDRPPLEVLSLIFKSKLPVFTSRINMYSRAALYGESFHGYRRVAYALVLLKTVEVALEMTARRKFGRRQRWRVVLAVELAKVICRLLLLFRSQKRMVLGQVMPERPLVEEFELLQSLRDEKRALNEVWVSKRTNKVYPSLDSVLQSESSSAKSSNAADGFDIHALLGLSEKDPVKKYLADKVLTGKPEVPDLWLPPLGITGLCGEVLHIIRPLIYVASILRYGEKDWKPWLISLVSETSSIGLTAVDWPQLLWTIAEGLKGEFDFLLPKIYFLLYKLAFAVSKKDVGKLATFPKPQAAKRSSSLFHILIFKKSLTKLQLDECKRRSWQLLWYLLRDPLYSQFTKKRLEKFCDSASRTPIISLFATVIRDYQPLWEQVYFVKAGS